MHRRVNRLLIKHLRERRAVRRVDPVKRRAAAGNLLDAVDHVRAAVREVVRDDDVIAALQQLHGDVRADKARAAGQQNCLTHFFPPKYFSRKGTCSTRKLRPFR